MSTTAQGDSGGKGESGGEGGQQSRGFHAAASKARLWHSACMHAAAKKPPTLTSMPPACDVRVRVRGSARAPQREN